MEDALTESKKRAYLVGLYKTERMHHIIFRDLARREPNKDLKKILGMLSVTEKKHASMWEEILEISDIRVPV
ncbi:MAG: hypothetical protein QXW10_02795, partial [Candidatus Micrarchaeaceae archaeon]